MKSVTCTALTVVVLGLASISGSAQTAQQTVSGTNPKPQTVSGTNPKPQTVSGTNPKPQTVSGTNPKPQSMGALGILLAAFGY